MKNPISRTDRHLSTSAIGRKYNYERWEQNLWNAIRATGYSYLQWEWIGSTTDRRSKMLYVPAKVLTTKSFYVDFLGANGKETTLCKRRRECIERTGGKLLQINRDLSVQDMTVKIKYKIATLAAEVASLHSEVVAQKVDPPDQTSQS